MRIDRNAAGDAVFIWREERERTSSAEEVPQYLRARRRSAAAASWGPTETLYVDTYNGPGGLSAAFRDILASIDPIANSYAAWTGTGWYRVRAVAASQVAPFSTLTESDYLGVGDWAGLLSLAPTARGEALLAWSQWTAGLGGQVLVQNVPVGDCAPPLEFNESESGRITLSVQQLRINQRIYSAAIRRANAIDDWLGARLATRDLCGGGLTASVMGQGIAVGPPTAPRPTRAAAPRTLKVPPAAVKTDVVFTNTVEQQRINQRIASKAVRLANAIRGRASTGG
ncbi:MAG: hypothetical protein OEM67_06030 [Thermoleophilia bacterium]|nr:hypothetical protein [Thermoleophilia bacterium]MDH3724895.1 hypothetical protein [Thermoleophilia bacterium]